MEQNMANVQVDSKKSRHFWTPFSSSLLTSSVNILLISVINDVSSILYENGIENDEIVYELQLFEKVNRIFNTKVYLGCNGDVVNQLDYILIDITLGYVFKIFAYSFIYWAFQISEDLHVICTTPH